MFVSEAHSVTQQSRLAITLAWVAGYTNAITLLVCHIATSHVSGITENLGIAVASQKWPTVIFLSFLLTNFVIGAAVSGIAIELGRRKQWESIYILPMAIQGVLLTAFALTIEFIPAAELTNGTFLFVATGLTAMAMGLQNATITRISNGVVRTTHVTGVLTDLGLESAYYFSSKIDRSRGMVLRSSSPAPTGERLLLLLSIVASFAFGVALGTVGFEAFPRYAMFPPVLFLAWIIFVDIHTPIAEIVPSPNDPSNNLAELAIFRLKSDSTRTGDHQRMPNFTLWASRLSSNAKLIVLDLSEIGSMGTNSLEELNVIAKQFKDRGRTIAIVGYREILQDSSRTPQFYPNIQAATEALKNSL